MDHFLEKYRFLIIGFLLIVIGVGIFLIYNGKTEKISPSPDSTGEGKIVVDIAGAVKKPGVYSFEEGARVRDAIERAGGFIKKADLEKIAEEINQAGFLEDEQKLFLPFKTFSMAGASTDSSGQVATANSSRVSGKVNINKAGSAELESLPGIGPAYATRIIEYRQQQGSFSSVEQLEEVSGIGPKTLASLRDLITI
jgi:competence protein ComEA